MRFAIPLFLLIVACNQPACLRSQAPAPEHQKAKMSRAPTYCQALVVLDQVSSLNHFVVDIYNKAIAEPSGFAFAKYNEDGAQAIVTFAKPKKPSLYYSKNNGNLHSSLCNGPNSPFFRCNDSIILEPVLETARVSDPVDAYGEYYEPRVKALAFDYGEPIEMGALFVALPLEPKNLVDVDGYLISGLMHVSLVKIWIADKDMDPTPEAKVLRERFIAALKEEFAGYRSRLPTKIKLDKVLCRP